MTVARLALIAVLIATGCNSSPASSSATVGPAESGPTESGLWRVQTAQGSSVLWVTDESGLVTAAVAAPPQPVLDEYVIEALPDDRLVKFWWPGGSCDGSTVSLTGTADDLRMILTVREGASGQPGTECTAEQLFHGLSLTMKEPVLQEAISVTIR